MKKRKLAMVISAALLISLAVAAAVWYAREVKRPGLYPPEPTTAESVEVTQEYKIIPDEEFYPEGYLGYRYPLRPGLESWRDYYPGVPHVRAVQIPEEVYAAMTTQALAQSVVCYPLGDWRMDQMLSSQSEQPADFVRSWFNRRFRDFPAMRALAQRGDAREALAGLDELFAAFRRNSFGDGIDPRLILQSAQFGGPGIPDNMHERP